ncbi:uncharacterized protein [Diadema setosum]|uniref:uncharacterized protein n=1 Tax=Diadema setosum TaxID=31175 RepID=UPI003B3B147D
MAWTGFTDEQLRSLKRQSSEDEDQATRGSHHGQNPRRGRGRPGPNRGKGRANPAPSEEPLTQAQMLSRPRPPSQRGGRASSQETSVWQELKEPTQRRPPPPTKRAPPTAQEEKSAGSRSVEDKEVDGRKVSTEQDGEERQKEEEEMEKKSEAKLLEESEGKVRELSKLEEFQRKQKEMEEENAKKKRLLANAIADRKKKTQAEAKRLVYIQKELAKIENLLSNDVSILRDKIETSSREFSEAQRRYEKAEAEFVAAKINLHKKSEMKEALTEHLCTIIHQNELRKAKKLEELVSKLDVDSLEEFENEPEDVTRPTPPTSPVQVSSNPDEKAPLPGNGVAGGETGQVRSEADQSGTGVDSTNGPVMQGQKPVDNAGTKEQKPVFNSGIMESGEQVEMTKSDTAVTVDQKAPETADKDLNKDAGDVISNEQPEAEQHAQLSTNET